VAAVAATFLQPYRAARQIDLVVRHEHLRGRDLVEAEHTRNRPAAAVHETHGLDQPDFLTGDTHPRELRLVFAFAAKGAAVPARQFVDQPEAGVVPRARILGSRIAQPDDEFENVAGHRFAVVKATAARSLRCAPLPISTK
jgi:hypothetical protein